MRYPVRHCIGVHPRSSAFVPTLRLPPAVFRKGAIPVPLTDLIEEELLATLDGEGDPQAILARHAGSKGPLYAAVARATAVATGRFGEVRGKLRDAQARLRTAEAQATDADQRAAQAERRASAAEKRLASAEAALADRQGLIARADALRTAGFDEDALVRLGDALAGAAKAAGKPAAEVVPAFLDAAVGWRHLAELRAQVAAAEQQAQARMADAKLTERAVKAARWLLRQKVTIPTVEAWQAAAARARITGEELATGLARALEEHGSLEAARQAWSATVAKLRADHAKLTGKVTALRRERDGLTAAIASVRDAGIAKVRETAGAATAEVRRAAAEYGRLSTDAAELRQDVDFAKALRAGSPSLWQRVEPQAWEGILFRLEQWSAANLANPEVPIPDAVRKQVKGSVEYPALHGPARLPLRGLTAWLAAGLRTVVPARPLATLLAESADRDRGARA